MALWSVKQLSDYLSIKSNTLYAWASQGRIPSIKIHGLLRFKKEEIDEWLESHRREKPKDPPLDPPRKSEDIDFLIARANHDVYNSRRGETRPRSAPRKEKSDGAV